jgi:hypothetical protein
MSTTSPVSSFELAVSLFTGSSASARGAAAKPAAKAKTTVAFTNLGTLSVIEYIHSPSSKCGTVNGSSCPLPLDEPNELGKEITRIVRPRGGLGMILHAEDRQLAVAHSLHRAVVQIDVGYFDFARQ